MFRVSLANAFAKRTCTPLYEKHQATPFAGTLAAAHIASLDIYSGMVAALNSSGEFVACDGDATDSTGDPFGLFALDCNATINDLDGQPTGTAPFAVWMGGPDALFKVTTLSSNSALGAFDEDGSYSVGTLLYADDVVNGQITSTDPSTGVPIGRVVQAVSATTLIVQISLPSTIES